MKNEYGEALDSNGYSRSVFPEDRCHYAEECTCTGADLVRHECFHHDMGGVTRAQSKRYGAWVTLCPVHHGYVHNYRQYAKPLQKETQKLVMERYGWDEDKFRRMFGKSYL